MEELIIKAKNGVFPINRQNIIKYYPVYLHSDGVYTQYITYISGEEFYIVYETKEDMLKVNYNNPIRRKVDSVHTDTPYSNFNDDDWYGEY